jgi:hypothetical protein
MTMACAAGALVLGAGVAAVPPALAQSTGANPAATVNGTVPSSEGNVWNGQDHQPTPADVAPTTMQQQDKINHKLQKLDQQLMNAPLPKVPSGAPPVAGNTNP